VNGKFSMINAESLKSSPSHEYSLSASDRISNRIDTSNNNKPEWRCDDFYLIEDSCEEKVYEELCYVTISGSVLSYEVIIMNLFKCSEDVFLIFLLPSV
jgi:hypothetical protein